jgi:DNA-binding response OmpR family regulator
MSIKILLLEDDKLFNETLQDFLEEEGFTLDTVLDPYSALDLMYEQKYDLYLFDVNLPYESGFELLEKLRSSGDKTPTIFITSREDKDSLIKGFSLGGDDYLRKPIDLEELLLRIDAVLRRQTRSSVVHIGDYQFDISSKALYYNKKRIELAHKASMLLQVLLEAQGRVVSLEEIKDRLWSPSQSPSEGALRVYVAQLKKYFPTQINNIRGVGYQMSLDA